MALIKTIAELRNYVKINASKDFATYEPFLQDAQEKYIEPYFGSALLERLETQADNDLYKQICRALGPFSLALATDELSIQFGEAGHTVTRTEGLAPASDTKIEKATASLFERGWQNLERAISIAKNNTPDYPEWQESDFARSLPTLLFSGATEFQDKGIIDINYSSLTFYHLRMLILRIEQSETFMFIPADQRSSYIENKSDIPASVLSAMQAYTASRVAALHTSQITRVQRGKPRDVTEYNPLIRPLYENEVESLNYYNGQAQSWKDALLDALVQEDVISADSRTIKYNAQNKKVFVASANRE